MQPPSGFAGFRCGLLRVFASRSLVQLIAPRSSGCVVARSGGGLTGPPRGRAASVLYALPGLPYASWVRAGPPRPLPRALPFGHGAEVVHTVARRLRVIYVPRPAWPTSSQPGWAAGPVQPGLASPWRHTVWAERAGLGDDAPGDYATGLVAEQA